MSSLKVSILVLCTNEKHFLKDCLGSLEKQDYKNREIILLDNASTDGSVDFVKEKYPKVRVVNLGSNLGYAKGNNTGIRLVFEQNNSDLCLVINADVLAKKNMVSEMVRSWVSKSKVEKVGLIQPTILLFSEKDKINTIGNTIHYLGFGYCKDLNKKYKKILTDKKIVSASGAALMISRDYYENVGVFDEDFFMYNEDQNLSYRGLMLGYRHILSVKAVMYHKYNFHRRPFKMYHSEKNRLMILLENYEKKTLILLIPIFLINELLLIVYSVFNGWFFLKLKSYWYVLSHWKEIVRKRSHVQGNRTVSDYDLFLVMESKLDFDVVNNWIIKYLINPLYVFYYKLMLKGLK